MIKKKYERPLIKMIDNSMPAKSGLKPGNGAVTHIDGVSVAGLIEKYSSPLFVVSEKTIRETYKKAYNAFATRYPKVQFAWSYKTNYISAVCNVFHQEGSWGEVVSGFEYDKAINNGVPSNKIIFNGPDKSRADIEKAVENDSLIHIDHLDEYYLITEVAEKSTKKPRVAIRVNMDTGVYPMWDRFGFNYENGQAWDVLNKIMMSGAMELYGLHCHIGTYMMTAEAYRIAATKLADLAVGLKKKYDHKVKYIDMGGGFTSTNTLKGAFLPGADTNPTFDQYAEAISSALLNSMIHPDDLPTLILETGRALIDDAGSLLGTVIANKRSSIGLRSTIIDIGVNILFTSFWYNHRISPAQEYSSYTENTTVYGPLCMNIDVIRESVDLPLLNTGDHVVIHQIGAYNMTQWMQFITLRPNVVMIGLDGEVSVIRKGENISDVIDSEILPDHLKNINL